MKYTDCPTVEVSTTIAASPAVVWSLVSDIGLSSRFSTEVSGADWLDGHDGPDLGARFAGRSAHDAIGEWTTTCVVTGFEHERTFEWSVIGRDDDVSSIWRYSIDDLGDGTVRLDQWFQMGPGRGGLNYAIEAMPDKEERIVARRLDEHRVNMERVLAGVKELAESDGGVVMTLKIGLSVDPAMPRFLELAQEAERIGVDSVWVAEYWAYDAFTPLAAIAAVTDRLRLATGIAQLGARTPAMLAMTAQGVQMLSDGRLILGIGASGPQVMEGWHGVPFDRPVQRTRETIEIVRMIAAGERLTYDGAVHQLPLPGGAGKAIRSRAETAPIPVYVASLGPANLRLTGELADGWIGNSFFPATADAFFDPIRDGAIAAGRSLDDVDRVVAVGLELTSDDPAAVAAAGRRHADGYAFTFGAMGSATKNFYNDAFARQGFGDDVAEVQRLWAAGDRDGAAARVPVEIGLGTNLVGPPELVHDRLVDYERSGVTTLRIGVDGTFDEKIAALEALLALAARAGEQIAIERPTTPEGAPA